MSKQISLQKEGWRKQNERDDEEEWGRIPIPQSDDSYSSDEWLSEEPEQHEPTSTDNEDQSQKGYLNCFVAFLIAPRKDGRILTKEGKIIDVNDGSASNEQQQDTTWSNEVPIATHDTQPYWTKHLMAFQRQQLRKGYSKHNRPKVMMKLMRQVKMHIKEETNLKMNREDNNSHDTIHDILTCELTIRDRLSLKPCHCHDSTRCWVS
jgi:hypothetical protein